MLTKHHIKYAYFVLLPQFAFAVETTTKGGLVDETQTMVGKIRATVTILVAGISAIALLWQFAQGFMGRKTWGDILESCLWIVGAGAAYALANWLFTKGQGMHI